MSSTEDPGTRGVVTIFEQSGAARVFRSEWASPEYLIPVVAQLLAWVDEGGHRLCTQAWLAYADAFPGTLPRDEVTAADTVDVDYRYELYLYEDSAGLLLRVYRVGDPGRRAGLRLVVELTRANLFAQAAAVCDDMADRVQRQAARHGGDAGADLQVWRRHASWFRRAQTSTPVTAVGANLAARLVPATCDVPYPAIRVAGVRVVVYVDRHGTVRICADLDQSEPWLRRRDRTVPVQVTVDGRVVFQG
ncbi:hypothetical protein [Verrucosispora sp. ts21]|uniref:hypothetical protein n=1 Tax=Verrucosispora sp. ts21 TaxID=2069341 RepID=UPI0011AF07DF|nr:hypothetical protein [Verrucosispora sp. ts21]